MKLDQLLEICTKNGVTSVTATTDDAGQVSLVLALAPAAQPQEDPDEKEMRMLPRQGRDGLTAMQQAELYGAPMTDTEN